VCCWLIRSYRKGKVNDICPDAFLYGMFLQESAVGVITTDNPDCLLKRHTAPETLLPNALSSGAEHSRGVDALDSCTLIPNIDAYMAEHEETTQISWRRIIIGWSAVFLFNVARNFAATSINGIRLQWDLYLASSVVFFGLWIIATPFVLRLASTHPLERGKWVRNVIVILAVGTGLSLTISFLHELFRHVAFPQYKGDTTLRFMIGTSVYVLEYNMLLYAMIILLYNGVEYFKRYRAELGRAAELKALLARSELMALKMQLHPHFLFNTHHAIVGLMLRKETDKAIQMLVKLSELLRRTLGHSEENEIPLSEELSLISLYLEIQQIRFGDRLHVSISVTGDVVGAYVPTFILQPLVENSITHGIAVDSKAGNISLQAERKNGSLCLEVCDDGTHIVLGDELPINEGVGIHTTRTRLEHLYGKRCLSFENCVPRGVKVTISIPYHEVSHTDY
jgi:two-component system, LytTR family, sensor kinase